jgi:quinol monooxygenase YgiN
MIHVLAIITAKPGQRDKLLAEVRANLAAVHAEKGCRDYQPVVDAAGIGAFQTQLGPDAFVMIEKWETLEDLMAHASAPHMKEYAARTKDLVASRVIHVLSPA